MHIEGYPNVSKRNVASTASGVMGVLLGRAFYIIVENFNKWSAHPPKHMLVAVCGDALRCTIHMEGDETWTSGDGYKN